MFFLKFFDGFVLDELFVENVVVDELDIFVGL